MFKRCHLPPIELKHWRKLLLEQPELSLYTAQTIAAKFAENQKINLDKLLLPLSYNIAKDCLLRAENSTTLLRAYSTVSAKPSVLLPPNGRIAEWS